jgi:hypothetical protein
MRSTDLHLTCLSCCCCCCCRSGYFSGLRKRSLLADQSPADQGPAGTFQQPYLSPEMRARVLAAHARNRNAVRAASTSNRNLLWAPPVREFSPVAAAGATVGGSSSTKVLCIDNTSPINDPSSPDYTGNYLVLNDAEYGQMVHDGGVCTLGKKKWVGSTANSLRAGPLAYIVVIKLSCEGSA